MWYSMLFVRVLRITAQNLQNKCEKPHQLVFMLQVDASRMAHMKKAKRQTDKKGHLFLLAPHRNLDPRWGSAKETFHIRLRLPLHPNRINTPDYRGKCLILVVINCTVVMPKSLRGIEAGVHWGGSGADGMHYMRGQRATWYPWWKMPTCW